MKRGPWHQCGDRSQKMVIEQLQAGCGVGVILSPRDLRMPNAAEYSAIYKDHDASVTIDHQYHLPDFKNANINSYPSSQFRASVSQLHEISQPELAQLSNAIQLDHSELGTDAVIAPAVVYEAGRPDILDLNSKLFSAAKAAGDTLGVPTYATVVLGRSVTSSESLVQQILSQATALDSDGWYYAYEFSPERLPTDGAAVLRCCQGGLLLACTGKPVLHAFAGPLGLLSFGFGATGAGIGHSQNLWHFSRTRWAPTGTQGGGGDAPPRFFSSALWGTIVYPDEIAQLEAATAAQVLTHSPHSLPVSAAGTAQWDRWSANKHLLHTICSTLSLIAADADPPNCIQTAIAHLDTAAQLHADILQSGVTLADNTNSYQHSWRTALQTMIAVNAGDFTYLSLLGEPGPT